MRIERIPMELLILLVSHQGQLVTRQEIVENVYPASISRLSSLRQEFRQFPHVIADARFHRRGRTERLVDAPEVIPAVHEEAAAQWFSRRIRALQGSARRRLSPHPLRGGANWSCSS